MIYCFQLFLILEELWVMYMDIICQRSFEIFVTSVEVGLFFYYISKRLAPAKHFRTIALGVFLLIVSLSTVLNFLQVTSYLTLLIGLVSEILFTILCTKGTFSEKLFWGCSYRIIDLFAESLTFLLLDLITTYSSSTLMTTYPLRYILCTVYLILLSTFTILITHLKKVNVLLPRWILPTFVLLIIVGVVAVEALLDVIIYFDTLNDYSQNHILYCSIWIFLFIFIFLLLLIVYINELYKKNMKLMDEQRIQQIEKQQFESFSNTIQVLRVWKHDSRQHFSVINELIGNEKYEDAITYIHNMNDDFETSQFGIFTGNSVLDAVISTKLIAIRENSIQFSHSIYLPKNLPFNNISLSSLMGNLFDNAITACLQIEDVSKRYISLTIKPHQNSLSIYIENSSNGQYRYNREHTLQTTKEEPNHGIGLRRIREISEDANGFCQIQPEADKFIVTVVVPLNAS